MKILALKSTKAMRRYGSQVWRLLEQNYSQVEGGLHYASLRELIETSVQWKVVVWQHRVVAVTVYKAKKGLKLVALASCSEAKTQARKGLIQIISQDLYSCWMELSERAERFVMLHCNGAQFLIGNELASRILDKPIQWAESAYHYVRHINNMPKTKVLLGTVRL